jgi:hypothetical protein
MRSAASDLPPPTHRNGERIALGGTPAARVHRIDGEARRCRTARPDSHHVPTWPPNEREEVASYGAVMRLRDGEGN